MGDCIAHMASPPTSSNVATAVVESVTTRIAPRKCVIVSGIGLQAVP
jgi:hypothetical protein